MRNLFTQTLYKQVSFCFNGIPELKFPQAMAIKISSKNISLLS